MLLISRNSVERELGVPSGRAASLADRAAARRRAVMISVESLIAPCLLMGAPYISSERYIVSRAPEARQGCLSYPKLIPLRGRALDSSCAGRYSAGHIAPYRPRRGEEAHAYTTRAASPGADHRPRPGRASPAGARSGQAPPWR